MFALIRCKFPGNYDEAQSRIKFGLLTAHEPHVAKWWQEETNQALARQVHNSNMLLCNCTSGDVSNEA